MSRRIEEPMYNQSCLHCKAENTLANDLCNSCEQQQQELDKSRKFAMNLTAMAVVLMAAIILIR